VGGLILLILLAAMWAVLIIPQQRRLKKQRELIASLEVGDDVMLSAGIYGTITGEDDDDDLFLEIAPDVEIRVSRGSVAQRVEFEDLDEPVDGSGS
jgi:preprotein translocase subunit YajC